MFVAFCSASSGSYLVNDALDAAADSVHPKKRHRPIPSGELSLTAAWILGALLLTLPPLSLLASGMRGEASALAVYGIVSLMYSMWAKHVPGIDVATVAAGFTIRAVAGGVAADVPLSNWFLIVVSFGALFVVTEKRLAELRDLSSEDVAVLRSSTASDSPTESLPGRIGPSANSSDITLSSSVAGNSGSESIRDEAIPAEGRGPGDRSSPPEGYPRGVRESPIEETSRSEGSSVDGPGRPAADPPLKTLRAKNPIEAPVPSIVRRSRTDQRPVLALYTSDHLSFARTMAASVSAVAYCLWAFERAQHLPPGAKPFSGVLLQLSIAPFVVALQRYALAASSDKGEEPEEIFLSDRVLQIVVLVWIGFVGAALYIGKAAV